MRGDLLGLQPYAVRLEHGDAFVAALAQRHGPDHPEVATYHHNMMFAHIDAGHPARARDALAEALRISENNLALLAEFGGEVQKQSAAAHHRTELDDALTIHLGLLPDDRAAAALAMQTLLLRKGWVLDVMAGGLAALRKRATPSDQKLLDELAALRTQIAGMVLNLARATRRTAALCFKCASAPPPSRTS